MSELPRRLQREARTVEAMIRIYCHAHHSQGKGEHEDLCESCEALLSYARLRLSKCPYVSAKPTCANCPIHCYTAGRREEIRNVMRYAGPRMILRHPLLAIQHLLDGLRKPPARR